MFYVPGTNLTFGQATDVADTALTPFLKTQGTLGKAARKVLPVSFGIDIAGSAITAPRKAVMSNVAGVTAGVGISTALGYGIMAATQAVIPIPYLGTGIGALLAGAVGFTTDPIIRKKTTRAVQKFIGIERQFRGLHMGGNYRDSEEAYTQRQRAAVEIGKSLLNARMYLGKEGALMHQ